MTDKIINTINMLHAMVNTYPDAELRVHASGALLDWMRATESSVPAVFPREWREAMRADVGSVYKYACITGIEFDEGENVLSIDIYIGDKVPDTDFEL